MSEVSEEVAPPKERRAKLAFKSAPTENSHDVLRRVLYLAQTRRLVFVGTQNEYQWSAYHDSWKMQLSRANNGRYCLSVYPPRGNALFIRSSGGGDMGLDFAELFGTILQHQDQVIARDVLEQLKSIVD